MSERDYRLEVVEALFTHQGIAVEMTDRGDNPFVACAATDTVTLEEQVREALEARGLQVRLERRWEERHYGVKFGFLLFFVE